MRPIDRRPQSRCIDSGCVGQVAATSFYSTKNLGCLGDGGALLTASPELCVRARCLRDYGQAAKYEHALPGLNSRLDEVQAAVLRDAMLPRLMEWTARRRAVAARYRRENENPALDIPPAPDGSESACPLFPVLVNDPDAFLRHLASQSVAGARHYPGLIPDQAALRGLESRVLGTLPRARRFAAHEVSLPIHPYLSDENVDCVVTACRGFIG